MAFTMSIDKILQIIKSKCVNEFYTDRYVKFIYDCIASNQHLSSDIYTENHHILPKSKNFWPEYKSFSKHPWNKSVLTARQHFIAHWMLSKALGGVMWYALNNMMYAHNENHERFKTKSSKLYESVRLEVSQLNSSRIITDDTRQKVSNNTTGTKNPRYGITLGDETKQKISSSLLGHKRSEESISNQKASFDDYWQSEDGIKRKEEMANQMKGKCLRPKDWQMGEEQKEKLSKQVSNTIWITDGNVSKRIQQSDDIPEGFIRGRKRKSK